MEEQTDKCFYNNRCEIQIPFDLEKFFVFYQTLFKQIASYNILLELQEICPHNDLNISPFSPCSSHNKNNILLLEAN